MMEDQNLDIRCGLFLSIQINKSVIEECIDNEVQIYLADDGGVENYQGFEFANIGDNTYEDMFYEEFKSRYIDRLNNDRVVYDDIIDNLVNEYINKKWINIVYDISNN
jgi:hypothetical protein